MTTSRFATLSRKTLESSIQASLNLDGSGEAKISTTVPFFDHMLTSLAKHAHFDLTVEATGDTEVDVHHTVEDTAIVLGRLFKQALGDPTGIARFGYAYCPLDESLARSVVDISGRAHLTHSGEPKEQHLVLIGGHFPGYLTWHIFDSFCQNAKITAHITLISGKDPHHIAEAQFKSLALALRNAIRIDPDHLLVASTKGMLDL